MATVRMRKGDVYADIFDSPETIKQAQRDGYSLVEKTYEEPAKEEAKAEEPKVEAKAESKVEESKEEAKADSEKKTRTARQ